MVRTSSTARGNKKAISATTALATILALCAIGPPAWARIGDISTFAGGGTPPDGLGDGGPALSAQFTDPFDVEFDSVGNAYISDSGHHRIRKITNGTITTVAGIGTPGFSGDGSQATAAQLNRPAGIAFDAADNLYIADETNHRIRKVEKATGIISTIAGTGVSGYSGDGGAATAAVFSTPMGVVVDAVGNVYIADHDNLLVRKVDIGTGIINIFAGNRSAFNPNDGGPATSAEIGRPTDITFDGSGNLFIATGDTFATFNDSKVRKVNSSGIISTVAGVGGEGFTGDGGPATAAKLRMPQGVEVDTFGNVFISDFGNHRVRRVSPQGIINTVAGNGVEGSSGDGGISTSAAIWGPSGLSADAAGNVFVASELGNRIRKITWRSVAALPADFDANSTTDISVYRPETGVWYIKGTTEVTYGGAAGDIPTSADYDGDTKSDIAIYRPSIGYWYVKDQPTLERQWGGAIGDIPVPGDYDGDGKADLAIYRPAEGVWYIDAHRGLPNDISAISWGGDASDIPVPGDYDADGDTDLAVYRASTGTWYVNRMESLPDDISATAWGGDPSDMPVPGDYNNDGKIDVAVYRSATGTWYVKDILITQWGGSIFDTPAPGDYDGNGSTDLAVFRTCDTNCSPQPGGIWYVKGRPLVQWGGTGDIVLPLPAALRS